MTVKKMVVVRMVMVLPYCKECKQFTIKISENSCWKFFICQQCKRIFSVKKPNYYILEVRLGRLNNVDMPENEYVPEKLTQHL